MALVQTDDDRNGEDSEFLAFLDDVPDAQFDAFVRSLASGPRQPSDFAEPNQRAE